MKKNPLSVSHEDMVEQARRRLLYMEKAYPVKVLEGGMTSWSCAHQIAVQKEIVRHLEKTRPVSQGNLFNQRSINS